MPSPACQSSSEQLDDCQIYHPNFLFSANLLSVHFAPSCRSLMKMLDNTTYHKFYGNTEKEKTVRAQRAPRGFISPASFRVVSLVPAHGTEPPLSIPSRFYQSMPQCCHSRTVLQLPAALSCPVMDPAEPVPTHRLMSQHGLDLSMSHGLAQPSKAVSDPSSPHWAWSPTTLTSHPSLLPWPCPAVTESGPSLVTID